MKKRLATAVGVAALLWTPHAFAQTPPDGAAASDDQAIVVTARRVEENLQDVPIPISVINGELLSDSGASNVLQIEQLVPSVQIFSSNPRNTALNIRGLGTTFGLTNDGVEIGVGLYVDGVFWARPGQAALDFIDVERVEVLRGPQGVLYGKNTTAGAINVTTRRPSFAPETNVEISFGDYGYLATRASITGLLIGDRVAGRLSFSASQRDGFLDQVNRGLGDANNFGDDLNDLNNIGVRGQLLFQASNDLDIVAAVDYTQQRPEGYAQVPVRVAPTYRTPNRQFFGIIDSINATIPGTNYAVPVDETYREIIPVVTQVVNIAGSNVNLQQAPAGIYAEFNAFERVSDADVPHRSYQNVDGESLTVNWGIGPGTLTSITARRFWDWFPSNDRDFIGLPITTASNNRSSQEQWSQEIRYAGDLSETLSFVTGLFYFTQEIETHNLQSQGWAASRWLIDPRASNVYTGSDSTTIAGNVAAFIPELLDGLTQIQNVYTQTTSAAVFGQAEWSVTDRLRIIPGIRFNYDEKSVDYDSPVTGGLVPADRPDLGAGAIRAAQNSILSRQTYAANTDDTNISGQLTVAYDVTDDVNAYATYATSFKSFGLNVAGVPANTPVVVEPESVTHYEVGLKTQPFDGVTFNITAYNTNIEDYQTSVVANVVGTLRGYLANAEEVRVRGVEIDTAARIGEGLSLYAAAAWTDGEYVSFPNSPLPIEQTGRPIPNPARIADPSNTSLPLTITAPFTDISGERLPGISEWSASVGGEYEFPDAFFGRNGDFFIGADVSWRTDFSSDPAGSDYLEIEGYALINARLGFKAADGWDVFVWGRNLADTEYYEILAAQSGGSGLVVGSLGDPRTLGVTLRGTF
ncbi:TonB-dependent receptor [Terricaulis silvestris]|uniref:Colicin I receptor n=1 Tax=Terricaulis silvestris TaxID=2686094 RepID=A0A6I6MTX8_9CAUL|nr:TonB-dependent receptor [Terricaulis silvestris]QGZ96227.1 Colicin I receptor precursor [Terricaulis silvestris]